MQFKKLMLTAGAVGAVGVAGSFGTFAAFTDAEEHPVSLHSGQVQVENTFSLPDFYDSGTINTDYTSPGCGAGCVDDADKKTGAITIKNTGTMPQDFYVDFDGPVEKHATEDRSLNKLAENISVDTTINGSWTDGDQATRLWKMNRRGLYPVFANVPVGATRTIQIRTWLRERPNSVEDNDMQNLTIAENVTVKAIEAGGNDFLPYAEDGGL